MGIKDLFKKKVALSSEDYEALVKQVEVWEENEEYDQLISQLEALKKGELDYHLTNCLVRAYNNKNAESEEEATANVTHAIQLLESVTEEGKNDPLWYYRMGYSLQEIEKEAEAVPYLEKAANMLTQSGEYAELLEDIKQRLSLCRDMADFLEQPMEQELALYEAVSVMLAIPREEFPDDMTLALIPERMKNIDGLELLPIAEDSEDEFPTARFLYEGEEFAINCYFYPISINPNMVRIRHQFTEEESEKIQQQSLGINVEMPFGKDYMKSFHLHLKIMDAILPDALAVYDISAMQLFSGAWLRLATTSSVPPPSEMMFVVHAVHDENTNAVWMHTHGLNRCGVSELEVLGVTADNYQPFHNILNSTARIILNENYRVEPYTAIYAGALNEEVPINVTLVPWPTAIEDMSAEELGGVLSRKYDHHSYSSVIYYYPSATAEEKQEVHPLRELDGQFGDNEIYFFSTRETENMHKRALERIDYMVKCAKENPENVLIKLGLQTDDGKEDGQKEHLWFEIVTMTGNRTFMGRCLNEPYFIAHLHAGDINTYSVEQVTDWQVRTDSGVYTPDDAYLME